MLRIVRQKFSRNKILIASILFLAIYSSALIAFATPPGSPFTPGETNDPSCGPTDTNCYVGGSSLIGQTSEDATETWLGSNAGANDGNELRTVFIGISAGDGALHASKGIFIGYAAGGGATDAAGSVFIGDNAGTLAVEAPAAVFLGNEAGLNATNAEYSFFGGFRAGSGATNSGEAVFVGDLAGYGATDAAFSNFIGYTAGMNATAASDSNFIGNGSGENATNASESVFLGTGAGQTATDAAESNFIGAYAGGNSPNASNSNFFGYNAGYNAPNAANSIFIGDYAGTGDGTDNTGVATDFNILIGNNTSTGGFSNSIAIGNYATNTDTDQLVIGGNDGTFHGIRDVYIGGGVTNPLFGPVVTIHATGAEGTDENGNSLVLSAGKGTGSGTPGALLFELSKTGDPGTDLQSTAYFASLDQNAFHLTGAGDGGVTSSYSLRFHDNSNTAGKYVALKAPDTLAGATTYTLPSTDGSSGYVLSTDGSGTLSWEAGGGGGGLIGSTSDSGNESWLGYNAGGGSASDASTVFIGEGAGYAATAADGAVFLGVEAGNGAADAFESVFIGLQAGISGGASASSESNFIGAYAGLGAENADHSNFLGWHAGYGASNANNAILIGAYAGSGAANVANSIIIGTHISDDSDTVDNTSGGSSIVIGDRAMTGGYSDSIALGTGVINSASNQLAIGINGGNGTMYIDSTIITGTSSTCTITTGTGIACSSDQRLKTNITDLHTNILDTLLAVRTVTYNWNSKPNDEKMIGFLAQDLEQYFPELVVDGADGYKSVYYSQMTPVLVEAIRELNIKLTDISNLTEADNSLVGHIRTWLADAANGIGNLFANKVTTKELCLEDVCVTKAQLQQLLQNGNNGSGNIPNNPSQEPPPSDTPPTEEIPPSETTPPDQEVIPPTETEIPPEIPADVPSDVPIPDAGN